MLEAVGLEEVERRAVDGDEPDLCGRGRHEPGVRPEMGADVAHAGLAPAREQRLDAGIVLQPQRHRRQLEHDRFVVDQDV